MRPRLGSLAGPALGGLLLMMFAGCGSSSPASNGVASQTPAQIVATAESAAAGAATVHVAGSIVNAKQPISLDMELVSDKGGKGRLGLEGLGMDLIGVDRAVYLKANEAFYSRFVGPVAARALPGRWLKAPAEHGPLASLAWLTDLRKLMAGALSRHGKPSRAGVTTIDGHSVVGVTDSARGATLYVAATGTPYPIEIVEGAGGAGRIVFDRWNKPVSLAPPTDAINVNQLFGRR
jgi:hypothetical protein